MKVRSYNQALDVLLSLSNISTPQYMKDTRSCEVYLKRLKWLLDELDNPQDGLRFIHIAGTSGKGSTAIILHEILRSAGYKVGTYTSPYVSSFIERARVNTKCVHPDDVVTATNVVLPAVERAMAYSPHGMPSYFEIVFAMMLWHFSKQKCDYIILEAGCGGKYDATNVIPAPLLAIITTVGLDHTELLGKTKRVIASRKGGIFKAGSTAIIGETDPAVKSVLVKKAKDAGITKIIRCPRATKISSSTSGTSFNYLQKSWKTRLIGPHQAQNARLAIEAAKALRISKNSITTGLKRAALPGRFEIVSSSPTVILDGAHNHDKVDALVSTLDKLYAGKNWNVLVAAGANDRKKDMFDRLFARSARIATTRFTTRHRTAANPGKLAERAIEIKPEAETGIFAYPTDALRWILRSAQPEDIVVVTGSLYLIGDVRKKWHPLNKILDKRTPFV